jgi:hypothetical protein
VKSSPCVSSFLRLPLSSIYCPLLHFTALPAAQTSTITPHCLKTLEAPKNSFKFLTTKLLRQPTVCEIASKRLQVLSKHFQNDKKFFFPPFATTAKKCAKTLMLTLGNDACRIPRTFEGAKRERKEIFHLKTC